MEAIVIDAPNTFTDKEIKYLTITNTRRASTVLKYLKQNNIEVVLDPWPQSPDTIAWTVLLSVVQKNRRLLSALKLLRRGEAAKMDENFRILPTVNDKEGLYKEVRPFLLENKDELIRTLNYVQKLLSKGGM